MSERLPRTVVHYALNDPRTTLGGVETFARNLGLVFEAVDFMTPDTLDLERIRRERLLVVCDNHWVTDLPDDIPAVAFQHGMAARKMLSIPHPETVRMAMRQRAAAKRGNTLWVACARWMSQAFGLLHGNRAEHVIYHAVDLDRFDGKLDNQGSRLVLHDGRTPHKGSKLWPHIARRFPDWRFEPLGCTPEQVPDRLRGAAAFVHLSRYEGNSIMCNEAMAMDLPCLFTRVGLMLDDAALDVQLVSPWLAFASKRALFEAMDRFLGSLDQRAYHPRRWVTANASFEAYLASWRAVLASFERMPWGRVTQQGVG
jgi:hypothetical protein